MQAQTTYIPLSEPQVMLFNQLVYGIDFGNYNCSPEQFEKEGLNQIKVTRKNKTVDLWKHLRKKIFSDKEELDKIIDLYKEIV